MFPAPSRTGSGSRISLLRRRTRCRAAGPGRTTMRVEGRSGENAAAYRSVAEAEVGVGTPHLHHIAHEAGPNLDWVPAAVQHLLHSVPKISSGHRPDQLPVLLRQLGEDVVELPGRDRFPHRGQDGGGPGAGLLRTDVSPFRDPTNELV